jgi:hypothetical protein
LKFAVNKLLSQLDTQVHERDSHDYSVYTGTSGIALLYLLLSKRLGSSAYAKVRLQGVSCIQLRRKVRKW